MCRTAEEQKEPSYFPSKVQIINLKVLKSYCHKFQKKKMR